MTLADQVLDALLDVNLLAGLKMHPETLETLREPLRIGPAQEFDPQPWGAEAHGGQFYHPTGMCGVWVTQAVPVGEVRLVVGWGAVEEVRVA